VTNNQEAAAAAATVSDDQPGVLLKGLLGQVAGCFPRRETRQVAAQMVQGLLMELEDYNCWTLAEAAGHRGPHRLQHLLSRAVWDEQQLLRGTVIPPPRRDRPHRLHWSDWRRRHQYRAREAHRRWNAYAEKTP
jgi:hypothetical protein